MIFTFISFCRGSFATVKSAVHKTDGSNWAVKCIDKSSLAKDDEEALKVEVEVLQMVNHANIVHLKEVFDCQKTFYMVMEEMSGGELFDRIVEKEKYTEGEARDVVDTLSVALKYCHGMGIVHRDLKPENLLYESNEPDALIKIADFGLAKLLNEGSTMQTACGTPGYVAPEILEGRMYDEAVDIWSLGVITYILYVLFLQFFFMVLYLTFFIIRLCGFPPFYDENNAALFASIKSGNFDYPSPYWDCVSDEGMANTQKKERCQYNMLFFIAKDLINKMLVVDPTKRYTAQDVLAHPWISKCTASTVELPHFNDEMRRFNARRRFRAGINAIKVINSVGMSVGRS